MHILVTNDDGIHALGLLALTQAMQSLGDVTVLAPNKNWSASGHSKTLGRPLRVDETTLTDGTPALSTDGAPSDCVALAMLGLIDPVNLVVTGINPHANIGDDVTYSGTVTSAMEAIIGGVPGLAFSLETDRNLKEHDYAPAGEIARRVAKKVIEEGLQKDILLSTNIPYLPLDEIKGFKITKLGERIYLDELVSRVDPFGRPYHWIGGEHPTGKMISDTDFGAINEGYVSITPLQLDMTARDEMARLEKWEW
ncbi:MAG: 5'/3'-nucleotidase SurE [Anaerolineae bacterium]|jgi:5'-nucleotidase|nr:5'/3'-nucleotidase SurE [Anaerolineae bacterium]MBT3714473.1 5'/3'-nucleotidase SurE [Anaerolineae bacterium]MBT4311637.1 5'/3'-nucleotidase SurE [Anaerolineae bacterium]MBT4459818.1 5'/3'-nucleotidase SurE [Anaerolineae bacterium]MBT4843129.1 5'/3'-nucleotidase SurE [Anaerolineae bacterium]